MPAASIVVLLGGLALTALVPALFAVVAIAYLLCGSGSGALDMLAANPLVPVAVLVATGAASTWQAFLQRHETAASTAKVEAANSKVEAANSKVEAANSKAEAAIARLETMRQIDAGKLELEQARAETERQKAETERQRADRERVIASEAKKQAEMLSAECVSLQEKTARAQAEAADLRERTRAAEAVSTTARDQIKALEHQVGEQIVHRDARQAEAWKAQGLAAGFEKAAADEGWTFRRPDEHSGGTTKMIRIPE